MAVLKKELHKKVAALKKYLLSKSNCCAEVVTLKKCEEVASEINLPQKSQKICEEENRDLNKKSPTKLATTFN